VAGADWEREFAEYVAARSRLLCTTAYLICGDWHRAEDHTQVALTKLYLAWRRIEHRESVDAYARRVLVRTVLDERRRPWRRERAVDVLPEPADRTDDADGRLDLLAALAALPSRQRAAVVLRYLEDLSTEATAHELGISTGSVKSHTHHAIRRLRDALPDLVLTKEQP
jgi:RNA polymerase sigma-70 factor (sigma-E family)